MPTRYYFYPNSIKPNPSVLSDGDGYSNVKARVVFCQMENEGQHVMKRYLKSYIPVESDLPHAGMVVLEPSAKDSLNVGSVRSQLREFESVGFAPESNHGINMNRVNTNFIAGDIFLEMEIGTSYASGYEPIKIYSPILVYKKLGLRR